MHKKYSKFLIVSFVGVLLLGVYSYFYNDYQTEASSDSGITSSLDSVNPIDGSVPMDAKTSEDISFLTQLISLKNIKIDTSLFEDESFTLLVDNNIKLEPVPYGRVNPFSPTEKVATNNKTAFSLKTTSATLISNKSAVLNGFLEGANSTNVYFEYGPTEALGKVTPKVNPSMIGNYSSTIVGLTSKTPYYYKITANINGALSSGDIMTFNTN